MHFPHLLHVPSRGVLRRWYAGLTLLHMRKPEVAHKCLKAGLLFLSHHAHVWLRLAEWYDEY